MAAPTIQNSETPYTGLTFGALVEMALNEQGLTNSGYASTDTNLPEATAFQVAKMKTVVKDGLVELQEIRERYWPYSEEEATAEVSSGTYPSVLLPADFGIALRGGFTVGGRPIRIVSPEEWLEKIRPDNEGGGTYLTGVSGDPMVGRILMADQSSASAVWRQGLWLYPVQTAAWTLRVHYRASAKALSADTDTLRLPVRLQPTLLRYCSARWSELRGDYEQAAEKWKFYRTLLGEIENVPPVEGLGPTMTQGYPVIPQPSLEMR